MLSICTFSPVAESRLLYAADFRNRILKFKNKTMNLSEQVNKDNKYMADYVGNTFWPNVSFHEDWNSLIAVIDVMEADYFDFYYRYDRDSEPSFRYECCIYDSKERIPRVKMIGNYKQDTLHAAIGEALRRLSETVNAAELKSVSSR